MESIRRMPSRRRDASTLARRGYGVLASSAMATHRPLRQATGPANEYAQEPPAPQPRAQYFSSSAMSSASNAPRRAVLTAAGGHSKTPAQFGTVTDVQSLAVEHALCLSSINSAAQ